MKLRDIMRPGPITIADTATLGVAHWTMSRGRVRHLPVTSSDRLVGILSERDILAARARAAEEGERWWELPVTRAMRAPAQTAGPDDSITEAAGRLATARLGALPIVDQGKVVGIVSVVDVLDAEVRIAMGPRAPRELLAADVMTPWPYTIGPDTLVLDAVRLMVDRHVRHLPVVDARSTLVGMLSERDLRSAVGDPVKYLEDRGASTAQLRVKDVMSTPAVAVPFDCPLVEVARSFADARFGAIPITDKFGALLGIVSYVDALRMLTT